MAPVIAQPRGCRSGTKPNETDFAGFSVTGEIFNLAKRLPFYPGCVYELLNMVHAHPVLKG